LKDIDHSVYSRSIWPQGDIKLTGGPHGMAPEVVQSIQRERLLKAMVEVVALKGYAATTVRDLLAQSRLSRRTYYDLYGDKEACYLDAFAEIAGQIEAHVTAAVELGGDARESVRLALESLVGFCVDEPKAACACLVESLAAGQAGRGARAGLIERLAALLGPALSELRPGDPMPALTGRATVGGVFELLYGPLARQDIARLRELTEQIGELPTVVPPAR
jgi:AcrR family transcriptional regulator